MVSLIAFTATAGSSPQGWGRRDGARQRRDARARCQRCAERVPTPGQGCSSPSVGTNAAPQGSPMTPAHGQPLPAVSQGLGAVERTR